VSERDPVHNNRTYRASTYDSPGGPGQSRALRALTFNLGETDIWRPIMNGNVTYFPADGPAGQRCTRLADAGRDNVQSPRRTHGRGTSSISLAQKLRVHHHPALHAAMPRMPTADLPLLLEPTEETGDDGPRQ
jgi:hypothetical protein